MFPKIPKRKGNQTIKFSWLIEYNLRNIFLEKSYAKYGAKTYFQTLFRAYIWINSLQFYIRRFYCMLS